MTAPPTAPAVGETLEVQVERLAFGGRAVARQRGNPDGIVVFVPFAAPGDVLRVEVTEREKTFVKAVIVDVLEPGPGRVEPRCQHFGDCGGCQYQHVDYAVQVEQKGEFVRDALVRTGGFDWPEPVVVHHAEPWGYRSRTQLKLRATSGRRRDGKHGRLRKNERPDKANQDAAERASAPPRKPGDPPVLGFHRAFSHSVIDIAQCPVLAPDLEQGMHDVRRALAPLAHRDLPYQVEGACGSDGASWSPDLPGMPKDLVEHRVGRFRYLIEPDSFFQGNRHLVEQLVQGAVDGLEGGLAFDLYAGVGLLSLPLGDRYERVVAVEDERRAATFGRVNARINEQRNVAYVRATTEQFLQKNRERPDLVMMDPPRVGAKPALPALLQLRPQRIVYVSCDPQTLARDLRVLHDGGYDVEGVQAYDMFPQTYHVESVARLRLR